jgi:hypothetical protein
VCVFFVSSARGNPASSSALQTPAPNPGTGAPVETATPPTAFFPAPRDYVTCYRSADRRILTGVKWSLTEKLVTLRTLLLRPGTDIELRTQETVPFWPTCAAKLSNGTLGVSGKDPRNGNTIVEVWTLTTPAMETDGQEPIGATVQQRREIYAGTVPGRGDVRAILPQWDAEGSVESILAWFEPSREVWSVNRASGAAVKVAQPTAPSASADAVLHAPYLSQAKRAWAGIEVRGGYTYTFDVRSGDLTPDPDAAGALVLRDANRDGRIDSASIETNAALIAAGWNQSDHWTPW